MFAPVAIFVYNRIDNIKRTLQCLLDNSMAKDTDVYVFSDGGKDPRSWKQVNEVRKYLHQTADIINTVKSLRSLTIIERPENVYLERNIIEGIGYVFQRHDSIIVLEDDICVSEFYLDYMNESLNIYKDDKRVMHVAGFTNLDILNNHPDLIYLSPDNEFPDETYFTPHMSGWGWGTWKNKWQANFVHYHSEEEALRGLTATDRDRLQYGGVFPCLRSLKKDPIPWDICWEIAIYRAGGLCLTPIHTMVRNIGLKNGTHFKAFDIFQTYSFDREPLNRKLKITKREPKVNPQIEELFKEEIRDWGIHYTRLGKIARFIVHLFRHQ